MKSSTSRRGLGPLLSLVLVAVTGCASLFHPGAEKFYEEAKGATGADTALNLLQMLEASIRQAKTEQGDSPGLQAVHDQLHALHGAFCHLPEDQADSPAFATAVTLRKELGTVYHRVWEFRDDPLRRARHLDLLAARLRELRHELSSF